MKMKFPCNTFYLTPFDLYLPGFPCLGVLLQKLENPALRACLKVQSNEVCLYHLSFIKLICCNSVLHFALRLPQFHLTLSFKGCVFYDSYYTSSYF